MSLLLVGDKFQEDGGGICFFHSSFLSIRNIAFHIVGTQSRTVDWINKGVSFVYPDIIKLLTSVCVCVCVCVLDSVVPDSLPPWDFPGKDTGLTCHFLLLETVNKEGLKSFISSLCLETPQARFPPSPSPERCSGPHGVSHPALVSLTAPEETVPVPSSHIHSLSGLKKTQHAWTECQRLPYCLM